MNVKTTRTIAKLITLSLVASTAVYATNGDHLIGVGAKARGMGGLGIAVDHGSESGVLNPAMISRVEGTEVSFGGTIFMPHVETQLNIPDPLPAQDKFKSQADFNMIPAVSIAGKIDEHWSMGIGMWGVAGMGVSYRGEQDFDMPNGKTNMGNMNMVTNLQLLQFGVPIAYTTGNLTLAATPIVQYGNLDIHYAGLDPNTFDGYSQGDGIAQDFGFGYNLGFAYKMGGLTLAGLYKSSIEMEYDNQLTTALAPFDNPSATLLPNGNTLEQPPEVVVGFAYETGKHTFAFDYKQIQWTEAKGYSDFGWQDSDVYALGYQYKTDTSAFRLGYNRADSSVVETSDWRLNFFNLLGFPATVEEHYTVGGSYKLTEKLTLDLAYVYAPKVTKTFDMAEFFGSSITTDHSQDSISFQLTWNFL